MNALLPCNLMANGYFRECVIIRHRVKHIKTLNTNRYNVGFQQDSILLRT